MSKEDKSHVYGKWGSGSNCISKEGEGSTPLHHHGPETCAIPWPQLVQSTMHFHYIDYIFQPKSQIRIYIPLMTDTKTGLRGT
jgi:hypothetical protein